VAKGPAHLTEDDREDLWENVEATMATAHKVVTGYNRLEPGFPDHLVPLEIEQRYRDAFCETAIGSEILDQLQVDADEDHEQFIENFLAGWLDPVQFQETGIFDVSWYDDRGIRVVRIHEREVDGVPGNARTEKGTDHLFRLMRAWGVLEALDITLVERWSVK
jgi:hypothetical protein